jgi:hypothetical protein
VRRAALEVALQQAVQRVALELWGATHPGAAASVADALGDEPEAYVGRYRLLEDRGERRALLIEDPEVTLEYVVVVEAHVDVGRVRSRLEEAGLLLSRAGPEGGARLVVVLEGVRSYPALAAVAARLRAQPGVGAVVPEEFARERVVLGIRTRRSAGEILQGLLADPPQGVELRTLRADGEEVRLRVIESPAPGGRLGSRGGHAGGWLQARGD